MEQVYNRINFHSQRDNLPLESLLLIYFGDSCHWITEFKKVIDFGLKGLKLQQIGHSEFYAFLEYLLLVHIYKLSPTNLNESDEHLFRTPLMTYQLFRDIVRSVEFKPEEQNPSQLVPAVSPNLSFMTAVKYFNDLSTNIGSTSITSFCVDGDKLSDRSPKLEDEMGLASVFLKGSQPGPVIHLVNSQLTNFILAICPQLVANSTLEIC